ncbi:MAG: glycosyltransferase family 4 protein, partial [Thermoplasmatales archaeon]
MRILQIGYLNPFENYGGVEKYILNLSTSLHRSLDQKVDILVADDKISENRYEFGKVISLKVPFFNTKFFFLSKYFYARKVRIWIIEHKSEYDIFHFHGDNGIVGKKCASRSVFTLHGISKNTKSLFNRLISTLPYRIEKNNAKMARKIFS